MVQSRFIKNIAKSVLQTADPTGMYKAIESGLKARKALREKAPNIAKLADKVGEAIVAAPYSLVDTAEQVAVPLVKGEGVKGIDLLGKDRSITEIPKAKKFLSDAFKTQLKAITPPTVSLATTPMVDKIPEDITAELGRQGAKMSAATLIGLSPTLIKSVKNWYSKLPAVEKKAIGKLSPEEIYDKYIQKEKTSLSQVMKKLPENKRKDVFSYLRKITGAQEPVPTTTVKPPKVKPIIPQEQLPVPTALAPTEPQINPVQKVTNILKQDQPIKGKSLKSQYKEKIQNLLKIETQKDIDFDPVAVEKELQVDKTKKIDTIKSIIDKIENKTLPSAKVKNIVRKTTGQIKPDTLVSERQALKSSLKRQQRVTRTAASLAKKETKETLSLIRHIKENPIRNMGFQERALIENLKGKLKSTRTLQGLRELYAEISTIKEFGKIKYQNIKGLKEELYKATKQTLIDTIGATTPPQTPIGLRSTREKSPSGAKVFKVSAERPSRIFDRLDGGQNFEGPHNQEFYNKANKALDEELRNVTSRSNKIVNMQKQLGITNQYLSTSRPVDGIEFTVDEMLSIYTGSKNIEKTLAIVYGNKIPFSTMRNVIAQMTPQEKALGNAIIQNYEESFPKLRQAFIEYTDGKFDISQIQGGYTPIKRTLNGYVPTSEELTRELVERQDLRKAYAQRGFTKKRIKIPKQFQTPIRLGEMSILAEQIEKQEHFITHGSLVKNIQKLINDPDWATAVKNKFGKPYLESIQHWANRVANPNIYKAYSQTDKLISIMRQNAAIAYLGFNTTTMLKQLPSLFLFMTDLEINDILAGIYDFSTDFKVTDELITKYAPQIKNRSLERELEEFKRKDPSKYKETMNKIGRVGMQGIYWMDKSVVYSGWKGAYNKYTRQGLSQEEAADRATRLVLRTQPAAAAKDLAELYSSGEVWNLFTQFSNQLNNVWNIISYDIPAATKEGRFWDAFRSLVGVGISGTLISSISYYSLPKKYRKSFFHELFSQTLNYIPLFGRGISSLMKGFDFTSIPAFAGVKAAGETLTSTYKAINNKKASSREYHKGKALKKFFETVAVSLGIPYSQPKRVVDFIRQQPKKTSHAPIVKIDNRSRFLRAVNK